MGLDINLIRRCVVMVCQEKFGKDLGLVHESIISGRGAGLGREFWKGFAHDPQFLREITKLAAKFNRVDLIQGMFLSPELQIEKVKELNNSYGWGFTDEDFESLGNPPTWPEDGIIPVVYLEFFPKDTPEETFKVLWQVIRSSYKESWCLDQIHPSSDRLRLYPGVLYEKGLRWRIVDVGSNQGWSTDDVRREGNPDKLAHLGLMCLAKLCPDWVVSMDGNEVPNVILPGIQISIPGHTPWAHVPYIGYVFNSRRIRLSANYSTEHYNSCAVPIFWE